MTRKIVRWAEIDRCYSLRPLKSGKHTKQAMVTIWSHGISFCPSTELSETISYHEYHTSKWPDCSVIIDLDNFCNTRANGPSLRFFAWIAHILFRVASWVRFLMVHTFNRQIHIVADLLGNSKVVCTNDPSCTNSELCIKICGQRPPVGPANEHDCDITQRRPVGRRKEGK